MKLRYATTLLILALTFSMANPARAQQQRPLTKEQVVNLVKNQLGDKTGARSIAQRGIDFEPTPDFLDSLKVAGADDVFIRALQNARRASRPGAKHPLNSVQVLALLGGQVPSSRVGMLVSERGINFDPTEDFLGDVGRSGGDQDLLNALRTAKVIKPATGDPAAAATEAEVRRHIARGAELNQQGKSAEAEQEIRAALQLWPHDPTILVDLASVLQYEGKWDESLVSAREVLHADPNNASAHSTVGVALGAQHDLDGAISELHEAIRLDPNDDNTHYNLGVALMMKSDQEGAMSEYREAVRLNPKNASAHYGLGKRLEFYKQDRQAAIEEYHAASTLDPNNGTYKSNYDRLRQELNQ